jgi:hypothetical protein
VGINTGTGDGRALVAAPQVKAFTVLMGRKGRRHRTLSGRRSHLCAIGKMRGDELEPTVHRDLMALSSCGCFLGFMEVIGYGGVARSSVDGEVDGRLQLKWKLKTAHHSRCEAR